MVTVDLPGPILSKIVFFLHQIQDANELSTKT